MNQNNSLTRYDASEGKVFDWKEARYIYDENGNLLGKVDDIFNNKSHDVYVIKDDLGKQILLPSTKEVIKDVDVENNKIVVHLIDGLV